MFLREPRLGAVKRRLAHDIGARAAWAFYRLTLRTVAWRLARDPRWRLCLAVTPDRWPARDPGLPAGLRVVRQGAGDLGERMQRTLRALPTGPTLLVGSDIPDISAPLIWRAFERFKGHDAVFGPATDGGYWLVGLAPRPLAGKPFHGVNWSSPGALAETIGNLPAGTRLAMADTLPDIDNGEDYWRWLKDQRR